MPKGFNTIEEHHQKNFLIKYLKGVYQGKIIDKEILIEY